MELSEGDLAELKKSVEDIKQKIMQQNKLKGIIYTRCVILYISCTPYWKMFEK